MAFVVSKDVFDSVFNDYQEPGSEMQEEPVWEEKTDEEKKAAKDDRAKRLEQFFSLLKMYLARSEEPEARQIADWMNGNGAIMSFSCRKDVVVDMLSGMYANGIPYVVVACVGGRNEIIIRDCDQDKTVKVRDTMLKEKSMIVYRVSREKLKDMITTSDHTDKGMVTVYGLTEEEMSKLLDNCADISEDDLVAVDLCKDGTYCVSCHGGSFMRKENLKREKDFRQAYLAAILTMNGKNAAREQMRARSKEKFLKQLVNEFKTGHINLDTTPAWIMSGDGQYMKVTEKGFTAGGVKLVDGRPKFYEKVFVSNELQDYKWRLYSEALKLSSPVCTYDTSKALQFYMGRSSVLDMSPNLEDRKTAMAEQSLINTMDRMINRKMAGIGLATASPNWDKKMQTYEREAGNLLLAAAGRADLPKGYSERNLREIRNVMEKNGLSPEDYAEAGRKLAEIKLEMVQAEPERIKDIVEEIRKFDPDYNRLPTQEERLASLAKLKNELAENAARGSE